ncbi:peptidase S8/S53 domain-containing protein, partial [Mycena galopus ATCC 62051]
SQVTFFTLAAFASANGLNCTVASPNGDPVSRSLPVSQANTLFDANFEVLTHPATAGSITRTLSVSLPSELVGHVDVSYPTTDFVLPQPRLAPCAPLWLRATLDGSGVVTPSCLQQLYGIPATPTTQPTNTLMVTGYQDEWAETADLVAFLEILPPDIPSNTTFTLLVTNAGVNLQGPDDAGSEASLDVQYSLNRSCDWVNTTFLSVGGDTSEGGFFSAFDHMATFIDGLAQPPSVMTTSYGAGESDYGIALATTLCNAYMGFAALGISVIYTAGDVHDSTECSDNVFEAVFPAWCPWVTSVGSTIGFAPEVAANLSSGGFSDYFPAPSYQTGAIAGFLETVPSNFSGTFNLTGRGFPDAAAQGLNLEVVVCGERTLISGTSASAPTFAAIIALINDQPLAAGKLVLGFLNPLIYSTGSNAFADITSGHNSGYVCHHIMY